ncbi:MAG: HEAT repeat domain-containing protein [Spirochaetales bacterium]|uniref:HEAT repeat domain-containing protein n=1 Tax=Candidatus Thalassospirochaeta sargassi TaxID=3119039 RepID=A0AAJ1IDJ0_9SPIO|nr:HEAT repeat domain-containing protein [Spirochaetales bacterium]
MKNIMIAVIVSLLAFAPAVFSQSDDEITVEEFYLQNIEMVIIKEQASTLDRDSKLMALKNIEEMIDEGKVSEGDTEVHYILDYLAQEGLGREINEAGRMVNNMPIVRKEACTLLGELGGEDAKNTLVDIALKDNETMVLSEAVYALGKLGMNDNNQVSQAVASIILSQNVLGPDDNLAYSALLSLEKIAEANSGLSDPLAFQAIIAIAQGSYIRPVKMKANELLNDLRKY